MVAEHLPDAATITRPASAEARDSYGRVTTGVETVTSGVPCGYEATAGNERLYGAAITALGNYVLTLRAGTDLRTQDTVTVAARGGQPERVFNISAVLPVSNNLSVRAVATAVGE